MQNAKLKVYLAGSFSRRTELKQHAERLRADGHTVTSTWLDRPGQDDGAMTDDQKVRAAADDFIDVRNADVVVNFTEPPGTVNRRGGRHVELGFALAWGKAVIIVGPCEHVFHSLAQVVQCESFEAALAVLDIAARLKRGRDLSRSEHPAVRSAERILKEVWDFRNEHTSARDVICNNLSIIKDGIENIEDQI